MKRVKTGTLADKGLGSLALFKGLCFLLVFTS